MRFTCFTFLIQSHRKSSGDVSISAVGSSSGNRRSAASKRLGPPSLSPDPKYPSAVLKLSCV